MGIKDTVAGKKFKFYGKLLESGLFGKEEVLRESVVWRHLEIGATLTLLKEWEIGLDAEKIQEKGISIGELIYFQVKDFEEIFGIGRKELLPIFKKLETFRKEFEKFVEKKLVA